MIHLFSPRGLACFLLLAAAAAPLEAAHPFYQRLLREGSAALAQNDFGEAQQLLRLASFGFLSEPEGLAESLVQLAVAEAEGGQEEAFRETFSRLLEIEERFGAYSGADLGAEVKERFEDAVAGRIPERTLLSIPTFRTLARRLALDRIGTLPKNERRAALQELLAQDPADSQAAIMMAKIDLEAGDGGAAAAVLESLHQRDPEDPRVRCLLGQAHAQAGHCDRGIELLESCPEAALELDLATALLGCYISRGRWLEADDFFRGLDGAVAAQRSAARLGRRINKGKRQFLKLQAERAEGDLVPGAEGVTADGPPTAEGPTPSTDGPAPPEASSVSPAVASAPPLRRRPPAEAPGRPLQSNTRRPPEPVSSPRRPPPSLPAVPSSEDLARLDEARRQLSKARLASDLEDALVLAKGVADRFPDHPAAQHLVAEIAYRGSRWREAAEYFRRGGDPGDERPNLLFFMAVAFFENGELRAARTALRRCLPQLQKTAFVSEYVEKILNNERR